MSKLSNQRYSGRSTLWIADASTSGFGACPFLRSIEKQNNAHCTLIFDELRAAPIKATTIPRLEQQAALLAAKQTAVLTEELQLDDKCYLQSDSKIVQRFISMTKRGFKSMSQTDQHRYISNKSQWHYVNTKQNPVDLASHAVNSAESPLSLCGSMDLIFCGIPPYHSR